MRKFYDVEVQYLHTETVRVKAEDEDEACALAQEKVAETSGEVESDEVEVVAVEPYDGYDDLVDQDEEFSTYGAEDLEDD